MIEAKVIQSEQGVMHAAYQVVENNTVTGGARIAYNSLGADIFYNYGNEEYCFKYNHKAGERFYHIYDKYGNEIGNMQRRFEKGGLFQGGFYYTEVNMNRQKYHIYAVGMGKDGIHYPCHRQYGSGEEKQIGLIRKDPLVVDLKDSYSCYVENEDEKLMVLLFAVYNDFWSFRRTAQVAKASKQTNIVITTNKKLKAKCNPDFLKIH